MKPNGGASNHQQGFAAIAAIFLVVVLAALGAFMVTLSNSQQLTSAQDLQGSRAYWAARAGLEWGIGSVGIACPASSTTLTIEPFTVTVACTMQSYPEGAASLKIFELTSLAFTGGSPGNVGFIERSLSAAVER